jgi:ADP-ribosylglycohydrolase
MQYEYLFLTPKSLEIEHQQLVDEGKIIPEAVEDQFVELIRPGLEVDPSYQTRAQALLDQCISLETREDYPYCEPSDLEGIRAERPDGPRRFGKLDEAALSDRLHAAWLGRCAGCLLGKPVEGWRSTTMWPYLKDLGKFPLRDYFRSDEPAEVMDPHNVSRSRAYIDRVPHMVEDDDTNYTITGLAIFEKHGADFTPEHVAAFWLDNLPILHTFTAERITYRNLVNLIPPPNSASYRNPYREWIGAQIRADFWGYAAVGNPELAAEWAWRDASISHVKNGIYGEMWVAAMLASAPFVKDARAVIDAGLAEIPARSRLVGEIHRVIDWHEQGMNYDEAVRQIHAQWDEKLGHHWCHTISNAMIVAVGLLWGEGDYELSICRAVQACFDTDCNGATVGSVFGMLHGTSALPEKWTGPLNGGLETGITGYHFVKISEMARKTMKLALAGS